MKLNFKNNAFCRLLNIEYPILQGGMVWTSGWKLATAVSKCGGFGLIGAGSMRPDLLKEHIHKAKASGERFGVNIPLFYKYSDEFLKICVEEKVEVVVTSAGNPKVSCDALKQHGILVGHVVSSLKFARKAESAGVDFFVAEGFEAGGHNGREELTTLVLAQILAKEKFKVPYLLAGGIGSGSSIGMILLSGASGAQIGSRFAVTKESSLHVKFKELCLNSKEDSTKLILKSLTPVRVILNKWAQEVIAAEKQGKSETELQNLLGTGRSRKGMFEGDLDEGELEIGQIACLFDEIPSVKEVFNNLLLELETSCEKFQNNYLK